MSVTVQMVQQRMPVVIARATALIAMLVTLGGCEKQRLESQMQALCKKDGGTHVYETVVLPPSDYAALYAAATKSKSREDAFAPGYRYVYHSEVVVGSEHESIESHGRIVRGYHAIIRTSDGKLMAEAVRYGRTGGDLVTLGMHPSISMCPTTFVPVDQAVFVREAR